MAEPEPVVHAATQAQTGNQFPNVGLQLQARLQHPEVAPARAASPPREMAVQAVADQRFADLPLAVAHRLQIEAAPPAAPEAAPAGAGEAPPRIGRRRRKRMRELGIELPKEEPPPEGAPRKLSRREMRLLRKERYAQQAAADAGEPPRTPPEEGELG